MQKINRLKSVSHLMAIFKGFLLITLCSSSLLVVQASNSAAEGDPPRYAVMGELKTIEDGGIVQIDENRYRMDKDALVVDKKGRPVHIKQLTLPATVLFEYSYQRQNTKIMAPVIVYMKEDAHQSKGNAQ